jgi:ribosomal protein S18 acetylase RimI-like enzyme
VPRCGSIAVVPSLLDRLERYYDTAPRVSARAEEVGPLTLFVSQRGWAYYARPTLGNTDEITADDVRAVRARQREAGVPESFEWVLETTPSLLGAAEANGLRVHRCPLLVLAELRPPALPDDVEVRLVEVADPELASVRAAVSVGFRHPGTAIGSASVHDRDSAAREESGTSELQDELMHSGLLRVAGAFGREGAIGGGSHSPRSDVTEVTGVGVLPSARRRGVAAAVTATLAADAQDRGVSTIFCSADSEDVARIYQRIGFRRVGTACIAEPPEPGRDHPAGSRAD